MEIRRTANAGVLLKLDGATILLDGVCREVKPYPATPPWEREALRSSWPDVIAFTHTHKDHYDPAYAAEFKSQASGVVLGPEDGGTVQRVKGVTVTAIPSRHIGAAGKTTPHVSYIVQGSQCLWFLGDASPLLWKGLGELPKPDVLLVPYAYAATPSAWQITKTFGAKQVVILHMPEREEDPAGLWPAVEAVTGPETQQKFFLPAMGQTLTF